MTDPQAHFNTIPPVARKAIRSIADAYYVTVEELLSEDVTDAVSQARQAAYAKVYDIRLPNGQRRFSSTQVGRMFNRSHTTVLHGSVAHSKRMQEAA